MQKLNKLYVNVA